MTGAIILQMILIMGNAIFAGAEIAVLSMKDTRLKYLTQEGDNRARKLTLLTEQPAKFLATIQVAITLAGLLGGAFAADNFAGPLVELLVNAGVPIPENVLHSAAVVFITLVLTFFNLVFGELVPKRIAMKKSEGLALGMSGMLYLVSRACAPLVWLLTASTNMVLKVMGMNPEEEDEAVTEEEIRMMLAEGKEQGTIQSEATQLIRNVFEFDDTYVEQICTHRRDVEVLYMEDGEEEWEKTIRENRFSFFPVCEGDLDNITGILDTKEYFRSPDRSREYLLKYAVHKPYLVSESMRANVLFARMKQSRNYFAVVLDEYGSLSGIVTLHDLLETLVGDLEEEKAPLKPADIEQIGESRWKIQGCAELSNVMEALQVRLEDTDCDTFNGFVWGELERIPEDGEQFVLETSGLKIDVRNVKEHMVDYAIVEKIRRSEG